MRLRVKSYHSGQNFHECRDDNGKLHRVDLFIDASLDGFDAESIVGQVVEVDDLTPFLTIASGVRVVQETDDDQRPPDA